MEFWDWYSSLDGQGLVSRIKKKKKKLHPPPPLSEESFFHGWVFFLCVVCCGNVFGEPFFNKNFYQKKKKMKKWKKQIIIFIFFQRDFNPFPPRGPGVPSCGCVFLLLQPSLHYPLRFPASTPKFVHFESLQEALLNKSSSQKKAVPHFTPPLHTHTHTEPPPLYPKKWRSPMLAYLIII